MTVRMISTLEGLADIRACWEGWQAHVNSDLAQFELLCRLRPEKCKPCIFVVERDSTPHAIIIGRLEKTRIAPSIGYLQIYRVPATVLAIIHEGVIGQLDEAGAKEFVQYLQIKLKSGIADAADFQYLPENSPLLRALHEHGSRVFCERTPKWSTHREMQLPASGSLLDTLRGKHRTHIRKREKELEQAFPGQIVWRWLKEFEEIPELCARIEQVAASTYQRGLGVGFFNNEFFRRRFELFSKRGLLRVQLLEINGQIRAFWFGFVYGNTFHSSETGYDPALREHEVGTLMFIRMVDDLTREGVQRMDFGLGDAYYKERFGHKTWRETSLWWFASTPKGAALLVYTKLFSCIEQQAKRVVQHLGLADRLKNAWRRQRAKPTANNVPAQNES